MKLASRFAFLWLLPVLLALVAPNGEARSSRNRRDRNTGPYRLIGGDKDEQKRREEKRKKEEEARRRAQEQARKKQEEARKKQEQARKQAAARRAAPPKSAAAAPKAAAAARRKAAATAKKKAAKSDEAREAEAAKLREQADKAFEKGDEDGLCAGVALLRQVIADYDGTDAAASAERQLDLLLEDKQLGPIIMLAEAQSEFDSMRYRRARNKFQALVQRFPDSEQAATARERLAEIERDDLLKKSLYTDEELEDARLWFLAGNIHLENGREAEALSAYRHVIEEYPGCRYARLAEQKLAEQKLVAAQGS